MTRHRGFSLVELLIAMAIFGILLAYGVPSYSIYMQNSRIRVAAESISTGLQLARSEALKRNAAVSFILTNDAAAPALNYTPSINGANWVVFFPGGAVAADRFVEGRSGAENGGNAFVATNNATITFTPLGSTTLAANAQFNVQDTNTAVVGQNCEASGGRFRCLAVTVNPGGQIRMCDPQVTAVADTRRCF